MKAYLEQVLAPRIQGDGGWVEYESEEDGRLTLVFRGECSKCDMLDRCCRWMESKIAADLGLEVRITAVRKKPFFWDNQ